MQQITFDLDTEDIKVKYYISNTCQSCLNTCMIYSIDSSSIVYCKRYKPSKEGK